jgi:hypothetical protein
LSILDNSGKLLARIGGDASSQVPGLAPDQFIAPHGVAVDSRGDVYIGEVSVTQWPQCFPDQPMPENLRCLRKLRKLP